MEQQQDLESYLNEDMPVTVVGIELVLCPLMRLRDCGEAGEHYTDVTSKYTAMTTEYERFSFPVTFLRRAAEIPHSSGYNKKAAHSPKEQGVRCFFCKRISPAHPVYGWPW